MAKKKYISKHTGKEIDYAVDAILNTVGKPGEGENGGNEGGNNEEPTLPSLDNMVKTTWQELKDLRDAKKLRPGCWYRMTDYDGKIIDNQVYKSARHAFDILILAVSENELSEECRAMRHEGDTYFPEDTNFGAWKIWYKLDNDPLADYVTDYLDTKIKYDIINLDLSLLGLGIQSRHNVIANIDSTNDTTVPGFPYKISGNIKGARIEALLESIEGDIVNAVLDISDLVPPEFELQYLPVQAHNVRKMDKEDETKGFIYRMIDERQNECGYDFKNIQYKRYKLIELNSELLKNQILDPTMTEEELAIAEAAISQVCSKMVGMLTHHKEWALETEDYWFYTFSSINYSTGIVLDVSTNNPHLGYEKYPYTVKNNHIVGESLTKYNLDNNVLVFVDTGSNVFHAFHDNFFIGCSSDNTFAGPVFCNNIQGFFRDNCFGGWFTHNTIGAVAGGNIICGDVDSCNISEGFAGNLITSYLKSSIIGAKFQNNWVVGAFYECTVGSEFIDNRFAGNIYACTVGNRFMNNVAYKYITSSSFGNYVQYNTFKNIVLRSSFGNLIKDCTFEQSLHGTCVNNDIQYLNLSGSLTYANIQSGLWGDTTNKIQLDITDNLSRKTLSKNSENQIISYNPADLFESPSIAAFSLDDSEVEIEEDNSVEEEKDISETNERTSLLPNNSGFFGLGKTK